MTDEELSQVPWALLPIPDPRSSWRLCKSDGEKNESLIGKFGVGFYSVFMVSDSVKVYTRTWKQEEGKGFCWDSDGSGGYYH